MGHDANKLLLLQLLVMWAFLNSCYVVALSQVRRKFRSSEYFTKDIDIPALPSTNSKYGSSIPVCYTNSPQSTSAWFEQHIPHEGATVGFDVEVSYYIVLIQLNCWLPTYLRIRRNIIMSNDYED